MVSEKGKFPKGFMWGASLSAHQAEGGNHNQWTVWELANSYRLAKNSEKQYSWLRNWQQIAEQAQDPANYISGRAADHFNRYESDFDILKKLNINTFRFGIEWSRIEPEEGQWNEAAIQHYKKYIAALKKRRIQPVITLWHFTMPVWFAEMGGFEKRQNIEYFVRFVKKIAKDLIIPCGWVITINEPNSYIGMSYLDGLWPPDKRSPVDAFLLFGNFAAAHKQIYNHLKRLEPKLMVGVATNCNNGQPKRRRNPFDRVVAASANYWWNWWFLDRIRGYQDFVGFNYYNTDYFKGLSRKNPSRYNKHHMGQRGPHKGNRHNPPGPRSDLGWYMEPSGLYTLIMQVAKRYKKPIIITETGVADATDRYRQWWLEETLQAVSRANAENANVLGYFVWSLLDNFEWAQGWWPKFGLVKIDRQNNLKRELRPSAKWLAQYIFKK